MTESLSVLVLGNLEKKASAKLSKIAAVKSHYRDRGLPEDEMIELLNGYDAVISEPLDLISPAVMSSCPKLKMISNRAVGYDNVDLNEATDRGILVTNTPGVLDAATADLAFALLLSVARRIVEADKYVRDGKWTGFKSDLMLGPDIFGKTVGIVGLGRIGRAFADRAKAFGLNIIYTRYGDDKEKDLVLERELKAKRVDLETLLKESDFVSLHCPYNENSHHLIGKSQLALMKPDAILINTARGKVVDQKSLIEHLKNKKIFGAGLDVFEEEPVVPEALKKLDNVVLTPHIGSACIDTRTTMTDMAVTAILSAFSHTKPSHLVNGNAWNSFLNRAKDYG